MAEPRDERAGRALKAAATANAGESRPGTEGAAPRAEESDSNRAQAAAPESGRELTPEQISAEAVISGLYHKMREGALLTAHRLLMLLVLVSSSSAVLVLAAYAAEVGAVLALVPGLAGALDMTFAFSQRASAHAVLARRFLDVVARVQTASDPRELRALQADLYRLYGEEPPTYEAVYAMAYNQVCRREGREDHLLEIPWYQQLLKNVVRFSGRSFDSARRGREGPER